MEAEISRDKVPLRNAYKHVGQRASLRISSGVEHSLLGAKSVYGAPCGSCHNSFACASSLHLKLLFPADAASLQGGQPSCALLIADIPVAETVVSMISACFASASMLRLDQMGVERLHWGSSGQPAAPAGIAAGGANEGARRHICGRDQVCEGRDQARLLMPRTLCPGCLLVH